MTSLSPDGQYVVAGSSNGSVRFWNPYFGNMIKELKVGMHLWYSLDSYLIGKRCGLLMATHNSIGSGQYPRRQMRLYLAIA